MNRSEELIEFQKKFRLRQLGFYTGEHWTLSTRPEQITLGSVVLSSSSGALSFQDCSPAALAELGQHFARFEIIARENLQAIRLNILCLMMVDPVVHFHIFPRYKKPSNFVDETWTDSDWPNPVALRPAPVDKAVLENLTDFFSAYYL